MALAIESADSAECGTGIRILFFTDAGWAPAERMLRDVETSIGPDVQLTVIDVWQQPGDVVAHEVLTVPTLLVLNGAQVVTRQTGLIGPRRVRRLLGELPAVHS